MIAGGREMLFLQRYDQETKQETDDHSCVALLPTKHIEALI